MTISTLPTAPSRSQSPSVFITNADAMMAALPTFVAEANALAASMNSIAAGGATAIPYTFSTTIADSDPGAGVLRLDNATQASATTIRADLLGSDGSTWTSVLDSFDDSTSTITGQIMLVKVTDATKWLYFNVTAIASPTGYKNITVANVSSSSVNPFSNGDALALKFTRTGDKGNSGVITRRVTSITSSSTPTPNFDTTDMYIITSLATAPTFGAPTGTITNGSSIYIRIKDNGTARALAWNSVYRAGTDLALPTSTVISKILYVGFTYNSDDSKWDCVAVLNNI